MASKYVRGQMVHVRHQDGQEWVGTLLHTNNINAGYRGRPERWEYTVTDTPHNYRGLWNPLIWEDEIIREVKL